MEATLKAVIFDVDGTAMENVTEAMPSNRVVSAVAKAQEAGLRISCATGRNYQIAQHIIERLNLQDPCVVAAGTQIIDPKSGEELWAGYMSEDSVKFALSVLAPFKVSIIGDGETHQTMRTADVMEPRTMRLLDVQHLPVNALDTVIAQLKDDPMLAAIPVHSSNSKTTFLHITSTEATKEHAVQQLISMLGINQSEVAGVGDGLNDLELFKAVGYKVAMGNARNELKAAADEVVATVDEDGLAQFLERFAA